MKVRTAFAAAVGLAALSALAMLSTAGAQSPEKAATATAYDIDPVHTTVIFRITHLGVSPFYGRFNGASGTFHFDADNPEACSFELAIPVEKVDTANEKRDNHLKSAQFFNARQFPEITFKSKRVSHIGDKTYRVSGDLSLHGVTKPLAVELEFVGEGTDPWSGYRCGFDASFALKRSDFGMNFMQGPLGDEVTLWVGLEGIRKQ